HWAVILSLASITSAAIYFILTRKLTATESTISLQLYTGLVGTVCLLPFALWNWEWPSGGLAWMIFLGVGVTALIGHQISIAAHCYAPASVLAPFAYSQIIWMTASSWLIFNEPPTVWLLVGSPIVIGSGLYIWMRERRLAHQSVSPISPAEAELRLYESPFHSDALMHRIVFARVWSLPAPQKPRFSHRRGKAHAVAPGLLGGIQRNVGLGEPLDSRRQRFVEGRNPKTPGHREHPPLVAKAQAGDF